MRHQMVCEFLRKMVFECVEAIPSNGLLFEPFLVRPKGKRPKRITRRGALQGAVKVVVASGFSSGGISGSGLGSTQGPYPGAAPGAAWIGEAPAGRFPRSFSGRRGTRGEAHAARS